MKKYFAILTLVSSLSLSPMAVAADIQLCGISVTVGWWASRICPISLGTAVVSCSAPIDGGATCAFSVASTALTCGISIPAVYGIIKHCIID